MLQLPNGCTCSTPSIHPKNWKRVTASVKKKWYVQFRFYDPLFKDQYPNGKYILKKGGINQYNTQPERKEAAEILRDEILRMLKKEGWNPITDKKQPPEETQQYDIDPDTPFIAALRAVYKTLDEAEKMRKADSTLNDIKSVINGMEKSSAQLRLNELAISDIKRKHIKMILTHCGKINPRWSANRFNKYRSYLIILFGELMEMEAIEHDPVTPIKKQVTIKRIRLTLTKEERTAVNRHLKAKYYTFWRFMHIFFHSGSRESELMRLKKEDVNLKRQQFKVMVKKGGVYREEWRTIKDIILPLWMEVYNEAKAGQVLFSKFLRPGEVFINPWQITRRWRDHVKADPDKGGLGIKADFYSLKSSNLDEIAEMLSALDASKAAGHKTLKVTKDHYLPGEQQREHDRLKVLGNSFVKNQNEMVDITAADIIGLTGDVCSN